MAERPSMRAKSHMAFGLSFLALAVSYNDLPFEGAAVVGVLAGSLVPDIDCPKSTVGRLLPFLSRPIYALCGHRTFTHGIFAFSLLAMQTIWIDRHAANWDIFMRSFVLGCVSHVTGDLVCDKGVRVAWPLTDWRLRLWPGFRTGGYPELIASHVLAAAIIVFSFIRCPEAFQVFGLVWRMN